MAIGHDSDLPTDVLLVDVSTDTVDVIAPDVTDDWVSHYLAGDLDNLTD